MGPSWRQVGLKNRWKIDPKRLGRFNIALGTCQEPPERETLILHWFWEVWGGVGSTRGRWRPEDCPTPLTIFFFKKKHQTPLALALALANGLGQAQAQGVGLGQSKANGLGLGVWCLTLTHAVAQSAVDERARSHCKLSMVPVPRDLGRIGRVPS